MVKYGDQMSSSSSCFGVTESRTTDAKVDAPPCTHYFILLFMLRAWPNPLLLLVALSSPL